MILMSRFVPPDRVVVMATILITGASSGLGEEMARRYAARGHNLALCARRMDRLEALRQELVAQTPGIDVQIAALDVTDAGAVEEVFTKFATYFGTVDTVIANAGIGVGAPIGTGDAETNRQTLTTNVLGMAAQLESALSIFRAQQKGHVVVISSFAAVRGMRRSMTAYSASKAAAAAMAEGLRVENIPGLAVTTIYPGYIATEMTGSDRKKPFVTDVEPAVAAIVRAIESKKQRAYIPWWPWAVLARLFPVLPASVIRLLT